MLKKRFAFISLKIVNFNENSQILTQKLEWKASPKVGSLANASHKPAGGDVKIFNQKVKVDAAQSKVGSLENANHKPAGGNVNIKEYKVAGNSSSNSVTSHSTGNSRRSSTTRTRMPGCHDPISPEEALGRN
uniref:Microtubule-associated protein n=1 Tax=Panagrolaimus superbus TaxID=310955 RepID=A0A914YUD1_9BILA